MAHCVYEDASKYVGRLNPMYILVTVTPPSELRDGVVATLVLAARYFEIRSLPCDNQSYDALKARFSATVGEEPDVEMEAL